MAATASAEDLLRGKPAEESQFRMAADHILRNARGFGHNDFKIDLARRATELDHHIADTSSESWKLLSIIRSSEYQSWRC